MSDVSIHNADTDYMIKKIYQNLDFLNVFCDSTYFKPNVYKHCVLRKGYSQGNITSSHVLKLHIMSELWFQGRTLADSEHTHGSLLSILKMETVYKINIIHN